MNENIAKIIRSRSEFLQHLENDIIKNDEFIDQICKEKEELEKVLQSVEDLKIYPQQQALIPLGKRIFLPGQITHTGEYYVKLNAHPNSYTVLLSAEQTLNSLKEKIKLKNVDIEKAKYAQVQLEERKNLFLLDYSGVSQPETIHSDRGVAIKVGEFFEIFEYEE